MATLANAPLIEAWVELRWGKSQKRPPGQLTEFAFGMQDTDFFSGQFRKVAIQNGFTTVEEINPTVPNIIPHIVKFRFRKGPGVWPCLQTGLGLFTVNQINEGYEWEEFKRGVIDGLRLLDEGHPSGLSQLDRFGIELRYRDGFPFSEGQTAPEFLTNNMKIGFTLLPDFFGFEPIGKDFSGMRLSFTLSTSSPKGFLITELSQGEINGQPGFIMDMVVRSSQENCPDWNIGAVSAWLESAHEIHRHAFKTLISPVFARTFQ
ncbi:MAG: TIGR04255 family protein [Syntrophobacteraceae bacterium]